MLRTESDDPHFALRLEGAKSYLRPKQRAVATSALPVEHLRTLVDGVLDHLERLVKRIRRLAQAEIIDGQASGPRGLDCEHRARALVDVENAPGLVEDEQRVVGAVEELSVVALACRQRPLGPEARGDVDADAQEHGISGRINACPRAEVRDDGAILAP